MLLSRATPVSSTRQLRPGCICWQWSVSGLRIPQSTSWSARQRWVISATSAATDSTTMIRHRNLWQIHCTKCFTSFLPTEYQQPQMGRRQTLNNFQVPIIYFFHPIWRRYICWIYRWSYFKMRTKVADILPENCVHEWFHDKQKWLSSETKMACSSQNDTRQYSHQVLIIIVFLYVVSFSVFV